MNYAIYQGDLLAWCATYDGEPFHALLCDPLPALGALDLDIGATRGPCATLRELLGKIEL